MNRVTNISWRTASGSRLGGFAYRYDALGRIVSRAHDLGGASFDRDYAYDGMDRLASDGGTAYAYDAAGNRTSRTESGETVDYTLGQGDRLATWTGGSYRYDAAGCVTRITRGADTWDLAWNGQYQLVSVSTNGAFAEAYAYDALGRRVTTTNAEGTERHVYDDSWQVVADLDEDGNVIRSYVWGEGIDRLLAVKIGNRTYTALTDVQGTVWGYADEQGSVVARWTYDAWGNVLSEEIAEGAAELRAVRYRFQGRECSAATGLVNFRMRWYDAVTGRWLSKDPIGLYGGLNLYSFCEGGCLNQRDISGLAIWSSHGNSRIIIRSQDQECVLHNPSQDEFKNAIRSFRDRSIAELIIYSHGCIGVMEYGGTSGDQLSVTSNGVVFDDGERFSDYLIPKMGQDGRVVLSGCLTAYDGLLCNYFGENISSALSRDMPGVPVTGNKGLAIGSPFRSTWNVGIRRTYRNGR